MAQTTWGHKVSWLRIGASDCKIFSAVLRAQRVPARAACSLLGLMESRVLEATHQQLR